MWSSTCDVLEIEIFGIYALSIGWPLFKVTCTPLNIIPIMFIVIFIMKLQKKNTEK